jgi:hypothetical protein
MFGSPIVGHPGHPAPSLVALDIFLPLGLHIILWIVVRCEVGGRERKGKGRETDVLVFRLSLVSSYLLKQASDTRLAATIETAFTNVVSCDVCTKYAVPQTKTVLPIQSVSVKPPSSSKSRFLATRQDI